MFNQRFAIENILPVGMGHGKVYFIATEDMKYCKVGWSRNPCSRLDQIKVCSPFKINLIATIDDPERTRELYYHQLFANERMNGEWFYVTGSLRSFLDSYAELFTSEEMYDKCMDEIQDRHEEQEKIEKLEILHEALSEEIIKKITSEHLAKRKAEELHRDLLIRHKALQEELINQRIASSCIPF